MSKTNKRSLSGLYKGLLQLSKKKTEALNRKKWQNIRTDKLHKRKSHKHTTRKVLETSVITEMKFKMKRYCFKSIRLTKK